MYGIVSIVSINKEIISYSRWFAINRPNDTNMIKLFHYFDTLFRYTQYWKLKMPICYASVRKYCYFPKIELRYRGQYDTLYLSILRYGNCLSRLKYRNCLHLVQKIKIYFQSYFRIYCFDKSEFKSTHKFNSRIQR